MKILLIIILKYNQALCKFTTELDQLVEHKFIDEKKY